jgi:hypothetical protein
MFKRLGALAMILAGGMAVFTPAVAQAREFNDYRHDDRRVERRDWREHERYERDFRDRDRFDRGWRDRDRYEGRRFDRPVYYYDRFGRPICR